MTQEQSAAELGPGPEEAAPMKVPRANRHIIRKVAGWAVVVSIVMTGFVVLVSDEEPTSRLFGESFGRLLLPAVIVGLVARFSARRWSMWVYPAVLLLVSIGLTALLSGAREERLNREARATRAESTLYRVAFPKRIEQWRKVASKSSEASLNQVRTTMLQALDPDQRDQTKEILGAYYVARGTENVVALIAIEPQPNSQAERAILADPSDYLVDFASGASMVGAQDSAGTGGSSVRCGQVQVGAQSIPACAWARGNIFGMVIPTFDIESKNVAELTRTLSTEALAER